MNEDTFDERELMAEIDRDIVAQAGRKHHLCFNPPPAQAYYIANARGAGIHWGDIVSYCKSRGWSGSESTMCKWLRAQGEN